MGRILEIVERSIYKKIEAELILQGYAVDKALYPNDVLGITNYNNAVLAIVASKGFAIDLFGVGSSQKKYILSVPRIVILKRKFMPGDLGGSPEPQYALNSDNNYEGKTQPPQTSDYHFQVNLCYKTAKHSRVLEEVIANSLNLRSYIKFYDDPSKEFFVTRYNSSQDTDEERGITEQIYLYEAKDIWASEDRVSNVSPSKIKEISLEISELGDKDFDSLIIN